jgi:4-amino-4-deoxy-L-arabinose transferase-like glycosyltransferase
LLLAFAAAWCVVVWLAPNDSTSIKDEPWHANTLLRLLVQPTVARDDVLLAHIDYPPLFYASAFTLAKLTDRLDRAGLAAPNLLFFLLTILLAVGLARDSAQPWRGPLAGLTAGLILFPASYRVTVDMSLVAASALFFYALARFGERPRAWPLIGVAAGLALLAKQTAPLFLAGVFVGFVATVAWRRLGPRRTLALTAVIALCAAVVAWLGFYREPSVLQALTARVDRGSLSTTAGFGLLRHAAYFPSLIFSPFMGMILLWLFARSRRRVDEIDWMALAGVVAAVAALSCYRSKFWEYLLPAYFPLAVFLARGVDLGPPRRKLRVFLLAMNLLLLVLIATVKTIDLVQWQPTDAAAVAKLADRLERWAPRLPGELRAFDMGSMMWRLRIENELMRRGGSLRLPLIDGRNDAPLRPDIAAVLVLREQRPDGWLTNCGTVAEIAASVALHNWHQQQCDEQCERMVAAVNERYAPIASDVFPGLGGWTLCERRGPP